MGMIDQIIDFNKTSGTTRMEEYVPTLSRDCHDVPLLAKKKTPLQSDVFFGVPGRTRTVDIQNHNLSGKTAGIACVYRCFTCCCFHCLR